MRVYELAKKLGMESRLLIAELVRLGIEVTSHSNALDEETARRVIDAIQGKKPFEGTAQSAKDKRKSPGQTALEGKKGGARGTSPRQSGKGSKGSSVVISEEPKKPEKKHILIKRKKTEEDPQPLVASLEDAAADLSVTSEDSSTAPTSPSLDPSQVPAASGNITVTSEGTEITSQDGVNGGGEVEKVAPADSSPSGEEQSVSSVGVAPPSEEVSAKGKAEKKDASRVVPPDPIEEKIKKPKKGNRARDEDLFAARYEDAARWQDLRPLPTLRREERTRHTQPTSISEITKPRKRVIKLEPGITVKEFAELLGQRPADIIRKLMEVGMVLTLNQPMNLDAGVLIAEGMGINVEVATEKEGEALLEEVLGVQGEEQQVSRAPVVTIMGHVDHGKTSLLDAIRQSQVTDREAGGITQHIGAYSVKVSEKRITFLDTPGHEAFTAMRARGAKVTDIVVLVVSADDGVMPQTVEAIHHAQAANVPIIVAINKMDKPGANPDRVKQGLSEHNLISEAWGGQTIFVEVSAKEKRGIDQLLEMILLQAEVMELTADVACSARGVALEAKLERGRGPVASVLVQGGTVEGWCCFCCWFGEWARTSFKF